MSIYVFVGPSIAVEEARAVLDATYLPPIAMGDLYSLMRRKPRLIAIIDGYFDSTPAVWHKEVLYALSQGVPVYGASSMGALRAAELHAFGMVGVGAIFRDYRDGVLEDDDEVAVAHGPAEIGYRASSDAMVNIRDGLRRAEAAGLIGPDTHRQLLHAAKREFYPQRFWPTLLRAGAGLGLPEGELAALDQFLKRERPNLKRDDAIELLRTIAALQAEGIPPHVPNFEFEPTSFWKTLVDQEAQPAQDIPPGPKAADVREDALRRHVRAVAKDRAEVFRSALFLALVDQERRRTQRVPQAERITKVRGQLRGKYPEGVLSEPELDFLADLEAFIEEHIPRLRASINRMLLLAIKRRGQYPQLVATVTAKWDRLAAAGYANPSLVEAGITEQELLDWYGPRFGITEIDPEAHAEELGLSDQSELYRELVAEYLAEKLAANAARTARTH